MLNDQEYFFWVQEVECFEDDAGGENKQVGVIFDLKEKSSVQLQEVLLNIRSHGTRGVLRTKKRASARFLERYPLHELQRS